MERFLAVMFFFCTLAASISAQEEPKVVLDPRYGFEYNFRGYPQKTPQEAMKSVVKAINLGRIDYLLAHLADPGYVDLRVAEYKKNFIQGSEKGKALLAFQRLVKETADFLLEEPTLAKELRLFDKEAEWEVGEDRAIGTVKQLVGRNVIFRRLEDRWFLENRQKK